MNELGEWLVGAREARGLTLEDAERDTRISRRYLQALEAGELDVIPAPVYARGFLRSYAQYLGLDPQEAMTLYPRNDGPGPYVPPRAQQPATREYPPERAPTRAPFGGTRQPESQPQQNRPPWRRPGPATATGGGVHPVPMRRQPEPEPDYFPEDDEEPTIGVDIGVPVPSRRLQPDPAAQTRSMVVLLVAVVAIGAILMLAFAISRFGGDDDGGLLPPGDEQEGLNGDSNAGDDSAPVSDPTTPGTVEETPISDEPTPSGIVPALEGQTEEAALELIEEAGLTPNVRYEPHEGTPGIVLHQSPEAGTQREPGDPMTIIVSQEP